MNLIVRLVVAVVASVLLAGCQAIFGPDPVESAEQAHAEFSVALANYLSMGPPAENDWDAFIVEGRRLLDRLREAYDEFSEATDALIAADVPDADDHARYRQLLSSWMASQERQATESARCLRSQDAGGCFAALQIDSGLVLPEAELVEMQQLSAQLYGP